MSVGVDLLLGISGHSHADPRLAGLPADPAGRHAFPAGWALIEHPLHGRILFDCGYGGPTRDALRRGLRRVYRRLLGPCCPPQGDASALLAAHGVAADSIRRVVISHFHPDHIGALKDFPAARFTAHADAWGVVRSGPLRRLHAQVWTELLPDDFECRLDLVDPGHFAAAPPPLAAFERAADLLGDGSLHLVELPGHALGQVGLALTTGGERVLLVADACWQSHQLQGPHRLSWLARRLATHDDAHYARTVERIGRFLREEPGAWVVPAHCAATLRAWGERHPGKLLRY